MSNKNRVNPDHYKVAGRDAQGEDVPTERNRQLFGRDVARRRAALANFIPGAAPVGESRSAKAPASRSKKPVGVQASSKRGVQSTSKKVSSSRHGTAPSPQTAPVAGAFGRENGKVKRSGRRSSGSTKTGNRGARAARTTSRSTKAR